MSPRCLLHLLVCLAVLLALPTVGFAQQPTADPPEAEAGVEPADAEEASTDAIETPSEDVVERLGDVIGELGHSLAPRATSTTRLRWDPVWPRYRFDELVVTLGMGLVIVLEALLPTRGDPNWSGTTDLDLVSARALGLPSPVARDAVDEVSSALAAGLIVWPLAVDSLLYAGLGEGAWDVAWQLSLISLEVFSINQAIGVLIRLLSRRERPLGYFCREEAGYDADPVCRNQPPALSFWSAHVSNAFAGASLVCLHHDVLDLFGDAATDALACGSAVAMAVGVGAMRLLSDQHWLTDVVTGAAVGTLTGLLVPWLLHFQGGARPPLRGADSPTITFLPMGGDDVYGLMGTGTFH